MVFASVEFLFLFFPITVLLYLGAHKRAKNLILLFASLLFYIWGGGALVLILVVSIFIDYFAGWLAGWGWEQDQPWARRVGVLTTVTVNLGLLGYFKYANFVVGELNDIGEMLGLGTIAWTSVVLPIGISFFTFQSMSYTIDVARGRTTHLKNPFDFALYVALFPQLIAGPIVRFHEIADQIRDRRSTVDSISEGVVRFAHGLAKKVIIADGVAGIADAAFGAAPTSLGMSAAWLGVLAYTLQIYFDFSGYSDMAIGLGRIFGFKFPENFNRPYSAISVTDFWRRWHMTLSNWFRDYLYIPLGGSHGAARRTYVNLWIVFLLTGAWHGANWTFVFWGIYHGGLLVVERLTGQRPVESANLQWLRRAVVLLAVMIGWVFFRAESFFVAVDYLGAMFSFGGEAVPALEAALTTKATVTLILGSLVFFLPRDFVLGPIVQQSSSKLAAVSRAVVMAAGLPYAVILLASGSFSPFLYFQF